MANAIAEFCLNGNVAENWKIWKIPKLHKTIWNWQKKTTAYNVLCCCIKLDKGGIEFIQLLLQEEENKVDVLIKKFDEHFLPRQNITYERYKFFTSKQQGST